MFCLFVLLPLYFVGLEFQYHPMGAATLLFHRIASAATISPEFVRRSVAILLSVIGICGSFGLLSLSTCSSTGLFAML